MVNNSHEEWVKDMRHRIMTMVYEGLRVAKERVTPPGDRPVANHEKPLPSPPVEQKEQK
jgi:hypothetical protein